MVQNELIIYTKAEKRFRIIQRGLHALDTYIKMDELLVRKTLHNMKKSLNTLPHFHNSSILQLNRFSI